MIPLIIDVDGVLTDGTVSYPDMGRRFNLRDGHGIQLIQEQTNIKPIIMSGEDDQSILKRCKKLGVDYYLGVGDKYNFLKSINETIFETDIDLSGGYIAISDDVPDIELLKNATLAFCPSDAHPEILTLVEDKDGGIVIRKKGGEGCVRQAIDMMLLSKTWLASLFSNFRVVPQKE